ncbi:MAG: nucleotidyl transferase AbiEii/AbiGii toxin family protein [Acidimicrobiia bacterium]|nr:nucleotidyl transferase AbiEii/AbiGii toxin family protein [Acidimicrobiia bacterium]
MKDINSLVADTDLWETIIDTLSPRFKHLHDTDEMAYKDLYVTEALRCAVVPSEACPQALVVFKGGTSLVKAHKIINRFSEDIDVNIIPPTEGTFGSGRRKRVRRELQARLNTGIPLPMNHRRGRDHLRRRVEDHPQQQPPDLTTIGRNRTHPALKIPLNRGSSGVSLFWLRG